MLDCARRTVQRHLAACEERGWVERGDGGYRLTAAGDAAARVHQAYRDRLAAVDRAAPLLSHLNPSQAPSPEQLTDADVVAASASDPQAPIQAYVERLGGFTGDRVLLCSPVLSRVFHDAHADLARRGVHTDLLLSTETARLARDRNPLEFAAVLRLGVLDLYTRAEPVPFGLVIDDEQLLLGAYDDDGNLKACLHGDDPELVAWGERQFETLREHAERVRSPGNLDQGETR
jgi:predicted transcriptional regulator